MLLVSGLAGGVLLIAADLSTLYEIRVVTVTRGSVSGHSQHSYSLALVGLAALPMALVAARRHRPAMVALAVLGVAALLIAAIAGDFHDIRSTGVVGRLYESATATPRRGFYFETLGAVLLIAAGLGQLLLGRGRVGAPVAPERPRSPEPDAEPPRPPVAPERPRSPEPDAEPPRPPVAPERPRSPEPDAEPPRPPVAPGRPRSPDPDAAARAARTPPPAARPPEPEPEPDTWLF